MNISKIQNIAFQLKALEEEISENMVISKILSILPEKFRHFSTAWDLTPKDDKNIENLMQRLTQEEDRSINFNVKKNQWHSELNLRIKMK